MTETSTAPRAPSAEDVPNAPDRRRPLQVSPNPNLARDYVVVMAGAVGWRGRQHGHADVTVRFVPDRSILAHPTFVTYLSSLGAIGWDGPEHLAAAILDDLGNAAVPRWLQVRVHMADAAGHDHVVLMEDRQPNWSNPELLGRLER